MRLFRDSVENLNVSRLKMNSKAEVGVGEVGALKTARVRARNSAKHQEVGGYYPVGGWERLIKSFDSRLLQSRVVTGRLLQGEQSNVCRW